MCQLKWKNTGFRHKFSFSGAFKFTGAYLEKKQKIYSGHAAKKSEGWIMVYFISVLTFVFSFTVAVFLLTRNKLSIVHDTTQLAQHFLFSLLMSFISM